jgi:hypothetical protein
MKKAMTEKIRALEISKRIEGVQVGQIVKVDENGQVFVDFPGNTRGPIISKFTNSLKSRISSQSIFHNEQILLVFENNNPELPIIVDTLYSLLDEVSESTTIAVDMEEPKDVLIDGERITFDAKKEIVLRCGKASITLTRAGKVIIRGAYLLNRSSGVNRIKGASVQIN